MKEKVFRNFSLKILSALCAIILWTVIVNIYDPTTGVTISNVPVQLINTESLTDKDYTYEVVDGSKISVYISGPKSVITDIKASDIIATADLSEITAFADYVDIDVKVVKDGRTLTNVQVTPRTTAVKLDIENRVTQQFDVGMEVNGTETEGYVVTRQSVSPSSIKITGSSTTIAKIAKVKAICDIGGAQEDIQSVVPIVLYDAEGNVIDDPKLELSKSEVEYFASVEKSKTVPIKYSSVSGQPEDGYVVRKVTCSPEQIVISGDQQALEKITEVVISPEALNVSGLSSDKVFRIWIANYLPSDVSVVSDSVIEVTVMISDINSREYVINTADVVFNGLPDGMKAQIINQETVSVVITGAEDIISSVKASDIKAFVNVTGLSQGTHTLSVQFQLPEGCSLTGTYQAVVDIEPISDETQSETTQGSTTDSTQTAPTTTGTENGSNGQ